MVHQVAADELEDLLAGLPEAVWMCWVSGGGTKQATTLLTIGDTLKVRQNQKILWKETD